jgi:ABC-type multidrug transport system fused ATPase/permease subunit
MKNIPEDKRIIVKGFWSKLWKLLAPSQKQIIYLAISVFFFEFIQLAGPYILKLIIDGIIGFNFTRESIVRILELALAMFAVNQGVSLMGYFFDKQCFRIISEAEEYLFVDAQNKMVFLDLNYHEKENTGGKIFKIQRGVDKVLDLLGDMFWQVGPTVVQIILTALILFFVDWRFGTIFLLCVPLFVVITRKLNEEISPLRKKRHDDYERSSGKMAQAIININTVKSFVQEMREAREFKGITGKIKRNFISESFKMLQYNLGRNFVIDLGRIAMVVMGIYLAWKGGITVGSLVFVITISEKALLSLYRISRLYDRIMDSSEAIKRLNDLQKEKSEIKNPKNGLKPKNIVGQIEFQDVSFHYNENKNNALANINAKINAGCVTALVGPSGGGKTTLARMIYRHYDPQKGKVLLDGKDLKDYDLYAFRKFISIVPQEVEIFNSSVKENIAYAKPNASFQEVKAAAKIANAEEFIEKLSEGYDTIVGERGIRLSGGQRQRVGIARAILANPRILIFDEATSSLDSYSERLIQEAMQKVSQGRTVVIIAHRLSTIRRADKIVVLEKGKVVEEGNHYQLASNKGGLYAKLLSLQEMGDVD